MTRNDLAIHAPPPIARTHAQNQTYALTRTAVAAEDVLCMHKSLHTCACTCSHITFIEQEFTSYHLSLPTQAFPEEFSSSFCSDYKGKQIE